MPIMSIKLDRRYNEQQCISEWHYLASGTPASVTFSFALMSAFGCIPDTGVYPVSTPFGSLRAFQNAGVRYVEALAADIYSVTDFYSNPFPSDFVGLGGSAGAGLPNFEAVSIKSNRVRADIRRGFKRYEGAISTNLDAYGVLKTAFYNALQDHAEFCSAPITYDDEGNTLTFTPIVISLEKITLPSGKVKYQKYATEVEQLEHIAESIVYTAQPTTTTQNSRKQGRGS